MRVFILLFLFFNTTLIAQTTWFDANWKKTSKEKAVYYRPKPLTIKKGFWVMEYYKNGKIKREGFSKKKSIDIFNGLVTEYFSNGRTATKQNFKNGTPHGIYKEFFESGELKKLYRYKNGKQDGVWKEFHKTGKIKTKGKYKNGEKVGVWKTFYKNEYDGFLIDSN